MGVVGIVVVGIIVYELIETYADLRKKKIEETSKTNNLALMCQILSTRPDISIDDLAKVPGITKKDIKMLKNDN